MGNDEDVFKIEMKIWWLRLYKKVPIHTLIYHCAVSSGWTPHSGKPVPATYFSWKYSGLHADAGKSKELSKAH